MSDYAEHPELPLAERELQDVAPRAIIIGLLLVVLVSVLLAGLSMWMFPSSLRDRPANVGVNEFPLPRLQPNTREAGINRRAPQVKMLDKTTIRPAANRAPKWQGFVDQKGPRPIEWVRCRIFFIRHRAGSSIIWLHSRIAGVEPPLHPTAPWRRPRTPQTPKRRSPFCCARRLH